VATSPTNAFLVEFSVEADRKNFCVGDVCWPLARAGDILEYRCAAATSSTGYCASNPSGGSEVVISSGGPFVTNARLTINLATGKFEGIASGQQGDRARVEYLSKTSGTCSPRQDPRAK
jgi:hypothetical protein